MTIPVFKSKKRGKKGEGRATRFKALQLPEDLVSDLKLYKEAYSWLSPSGEDEYGNPIPSKVSFEQMFRRWMDNVCLFDPEVAADVKRIKDEWKKWGVSLPHFDSVNPFDYPVQDFRYSFLVDGLESEAVFNGTTFVCRDKEDKDVDGLTLDEMYNNNWPLMNDAAYEYSLEQAHELCRRLAELAKGK